MSADLWKSGMASPPKTVTPCPYRSYRQLNEADLFSGKFEE